MQKLQVKFSHSGVHCIANCSHNRMSWASGWKRLPSIDGRIAIRMANKWPRCCNGGCIGEKMYAMARTLATNMWHLMFLWLQPQRHSVLPLLAKLRAMARILWSIASPSAAAIAFVGLLDGSDCRQLTAASPSRWPIHGPAAAMGDALVRTCVPWRAPWQRTGGT